MPTINMLTVEVRGVDLKTNPLLLGGGSARMAANMVFDEGSIRTRPGFRYHRTKLFGQFQGFSEFRPSAGISSGVFSESGPSIIIVAGGIVGASTIGGGEVFCAQSFVHPSPIFMCSGDVNVYQAENFAVIQNVETSTYWFDGKSLKESPGMQEQDWNDPDYLWDEVEKVEPVSNSVFCENSSEEYLNKVVIRVINIKTSEIIPNALVEVRYNRQVAYSGFTDDKGLVTFFVYPRLYEVVAYAAGFTENSEEPVRFEASSRGSYVTEGCEQEYQGLSSVQQVDVLIGPLVTLGWVVEVRYSGAEGPCPGGHVCDAAVFDVMLNGALVGKAVLNNFEDAGDRFASFTIDSELAVAIGPAIDGKFMLSFSCDPTYPGFDLITFDGGCHPGVGWVRVFDAENNMLYEGCPDEGDFLEIDPNIAP